MDGIDGNDLAVWRPAWMEVVADVAYEARRLEVAKVADRGDGPRC